MPQAKTDDKATKLTDADVLDPNHPFNGDADPDDPLKGVDPDTGKKAGKKVKVKVADAEMETDEASAAVINALQKQNTDLYAYLKNIGAPSKPEPKKADPKDGGKPYDWSTELFVDPEGALKRLRAELKEEIKTEMTTAYNNAEGEKTFWNLFYKDNDELKEHDHFVRAILNRDYAELADLPTAKAAAELSTRVKKELLKLRGGRSNADESDRSLEGGSTRSNAKNTGQNKEEVVSSLGDLIRKRAAARRASTSLTKEK